MDTIGITPPIVLPALQTTASPPQVAAPDTTTQQPAVDPAPAQATENDTTAQTQVSLKAAEEKRYEAIRQAAQHIANSYVVSDKTFTIFKDVTGQYITRFTSLRDGRVTYIPEPQLLRSNAPEEAISLVNIKA